MINHRARFHCRRCEEQKSSGLGKKSAFAAVPGAARHYAPDRPLKLEHILIDIELDPKTKKFRSVVTQRVQIIQSGLASMKLDQVGLSIQKVEISGSPAEFLVEGSQLTVRLPKEIQSKKVGESFEFKIDYSGADPKRGLYFTGPDADYPDKPYQVWSQGQDEDNRHWIPTFDYPNQKALSEVIATVPKGYTAVANGGLISKNEVGDQTRYHYRLGTPHVTYLISLVVAEFVELNAQGPAGLPVQYFVPKGREADAKRAFGNTPKMIAAYAEKIGVPYPYEKYAQTAVQDFIFGGMENTSSTTQTDRTLHDERAHLDFSSDPLVSHELAHQWFGDLLTCRDWSHGWLNEGFATFMERVWIENNRDDFGEQTVDEAKYYGLADLRDYLEEDGKDYRRSIVCNTYIEPIDLFDRHLYQKGGLVLNLIRAELGEKPFWDSIKTYVTRHRGQSVETVDLIRAIEDTTGRNLRRLFDEWVYGAGHPDLELTYTWHDDKKLVEITIEQKQTDKRPEVTQDGFVTHLFHLSAVVQLTIEGGGVQSHSIELGEARERLFLSAPSKPVMVRFDPGATIPKTMKFSRPKELLLYQLEKDSDCMGRIEAAHELGKIADAQVLQALSVSLQKDPFWGVQAEVADVLSELRMPGAEDALIAGLSVQHPKARRAVIAALATYKSKKSMIALEKLAQKDPSYLVEAQATTALGSISSQAKGELRQEDLTRIEKLLEAQLKKTAHLDSISASALRAMAKLPGVGHGERPQVLSTLMEWSRRGKPITARAAAVMGLAEVARSANLSERAKILALLNELADEDSFQLRYTLVPALKACESSKVIPILEKIHALDVDGRIKRSAQGARDAVLGSGGIPESVSNLKEALEKLEEDYRKVKGWVEEQKGQAKPVPKS